MKHIKYPFIAIFPPFAAGILLNTWLKINTPQLPYILAGLIAIIIITEKIPHKKNYLFGITIYSLLFLTGIFADQVNYETKPNNHETKQKYYQGIVTEQPKEKEKSIQTIIKLQATKDTTANWTKFETKTVLYIQKNEQTEQIKYGDRILFTTYLNEITNPGNPLEFNYKTYMANQGIHFTAYAKTNQYRILEHNQGKYLKTLALNIRNSFLKIYKKFNIDGQNFAVLSALTLGYRDEVEPETRQMFANTGAMHILAVSGLHVGIIFMILTNLLAFMDKKKGLFYLKSIIIIASLWMFAFIAGLSPSVTRSALMFSMFVVGKMIRKTSSIYNIIFASAFILLLINPRDIYSVGFQLSYAAVLAIVFFQPYIYKLLVFQKKIPDKIWALLSVSIAAQIGTMPIGLHFFHQFPNYFFLTNILVIPLASIILYLAVLLLAISWIPFLNSIIAFVLKITLKFLLTGIKFIDNIPFATTQNIYITSWQTGILFIIILSFTLFWIFNKKQILYIFLTSLIIFLILDINLNYHNKKEKYLTIFNVRNSLVMNVLGENNLVITEKEIQQNAKPLEYACKPYWLSKRISKLKLFCIDLIQKKEKFIEQEIYAKKMFMKIGNKTMMIIRDNKIFEYQTSEKIKVNYIILSKNTYLNIKDITKLVDFDMIIFDSSNKNYRTKEWKTQCLALNIPFFDILSEGAFVINYNKKSK